ncbi:FeoA family protein [Sphingobacterium psychroaquaticum]|uniref:Ferrous iron transport protein A n=1 Tax=Sphingobacterium psychroaquaticum TaxID=561061 RepID=A0A1X7JN58_9SPHI|nr:FeoA family protein [Sphingobacterium psychroaquaticum]QBQ40896.1 ferrous iron transport protein A [Sphingobacterium psychroaquaticum]SMG29650.1 ferrous iron transport protein A [Sphingobacterium psychroaquaticum]
MQKSFSLDTLTIGECARISEVNATELPSKFLEMGLLPGCLVEIKHKAPFNGPIGLHIHTSNTLIAIRKSEAYHILVEKNSL